MKCWPRRHRTTPDAAARDSKILEAKVRVSDLETRADRTAETLRHRMSQNNFAAGIAVAWGRTTRGGGRRS